LFLEFAGGMMPSTGGCAVFARAAAPPVSSFHRQPWSEVFYGSYGTTAFAHDHDAIFRQ
jgi:hypothetical protein